MNNGQQNVNNFFAYLNLNQQQLQNQQNNNQGPNLNLQNIFNPINDVNANYNVAVNGTAPINNAFQAFLNTNNVQMSNLGAFSTLFNSRKEG